MSWQAIKKTLPADAPRKIEIFDVQDQTACGKLTAQWGTDYFQLAKYDGRWLITNIVWQSPPPQKTIDPGATSVKPRCLR